MLDDLPRPKGPPESLGPPRQAKRQKVAAEVASDDVIQVANWGRDDDDDDDDEEGNRN